MWITMKTGVRPFIHVSKQTSTCIDNLIKLHRAFSVLTQNICCWMYLFVCSKKATSNNLIHLSHSHHEWRESIERRRWVPFWHGIQHVNMKLYQTITIYCIKSGDISILHWKRYLLALLSFNYELLFLSLLVAWGFVTVHIVVLYILSSATICTDPHCTYCRPSAHIVADKKVVHIVVGDNMCLTSLHILSSHRCWCLRMFFIVLWM